MPAVAQQYITFVPLMRRIDIHVHFSFYFCAWEGFEPIILRPFGSYATANQLPINVDS